MGVTAQEGGRRTYYFRLSACETAIIRTALEKEGFEKLLEGEGDCALMLAGEVSGRIGDLPKVPELIQRIVQEAEETISKLVKHVS